MSFASLSTRRTLILLAKVALACLILGYLIVQAQRHDGFTRLVQQPKHWRLIGAGLVCLFVSVALSFVRWYLLVTPLKLNFRLADAMRLGSLGFVLNFVSLGNVGGDLFKAIFLAREQPGRKTEAVATVLADRVLGLASMLLLASTVILFTSLGETVPDRVALLCKAVLLATAIGIGGICLLLTPGMSGTRISGWAAAVPWVGTTMAQLINAVRAYREQKMLLLAATLVCLVVDVLFVFSFFLIASGLPMEAPSFADHLFVVPLSAMAGAIPATPNGLGTMEAAVDALYQAVPSGANGSPGDGTLATLAHRLAMMAVASIGLFYYLSQRADLRRAVTEIEELSEIEELPEMG